MTTRVVFLRAGVVGHRLFRRHTRAYVWAVREAVAGRVDLAAIETGPGVMHIFNRFGECYKLAGTVADLVRVAEAEGKRAA